MLSILVHALRYFLWLPAMVRNLMAPIRPQRCIALQSGTVRSLMPGGAVTVSLQTSSNVNPISMVICDNHEVTV